MQAQTEELWLQAFDFAQKCSAQLGKTLRIYSSLSLRGTSFDRHHTLFSAHNFVLRNSAVRISGSILMLMGEQDWEQYEIDVASVRSIGEENGQILIMEQYSEQIFRKTRLLFS